MRNSGAKKIGIFTQDISIGGGVFTEAKAVYSMHEQWGFKPYYIYVPHVAMSKNTAPPPRKGSKYFFILPDFNSSG